MTRTLGFLATITVLATVGAAAENYSLATRAAQDHAQNGGQLAAQEISGHQSTQSPNSIPISTSQTSRAWSQATVVDRASLAVDSQTGAFGPNSTKRAGAARRETSAAPDSSGRETTSSRDAAVQDASQEPATPRGQLPQTSTILPLLGLIGLGSLVAGFFARR